MPKLPQLVFATNNPHKLSEVQQILGNSIELLSLSDIGFPDEIPEDFNTLEENASQKAWHIYNKYKMNCFADDTGLEVDALHGEPGVRSARYAGEGKSPSDNIEKLLRKLTGVSNRIAQFRTVISLIIDGTEYQFEGVVKGEIIEEYRGSLGFGYDPLFIPLGYEETFAQMDPKLKNEISHRGLAIKKLTRFLHDKLHQRNSRGEED
jgi:XTP/dITP diphosphohydrolase